MVTALVPAAKKRAELLKDMTPVGRKLAEDFAKKLGIGARGIVMIQYDLGARVGTAIENEAEYGVNYVSLLAEYLSMPGGESTLYSLRNFATAFDRKFVEGESSIASENGNFLELGHWIKLSQLQDQSDVRSWLKRIRKESLSVRAFSQEIAATGAKMKNSRQGGRKPTTPTSPIAGLQQTFSIAQKFANMEPVLEKSVFAEIDTMPSEKISEDLLLKLEATREKLTEMDAACGKALKHVDKNIDRVKRVLEARPPEEKAAPKAKAKAKAKGAKAKKPKAKKPTKPAAKGKGTGKGKKKPARKRPQIQTVE